MPKTIESYLVCDVIRELYKGNKNACDREPREIGFCGTCKAAEKFLKDKMNHASGGSSFNFSAEKNEASIIYSYSNPENRNRQTLVHETVIRGKLTTTANPTS